MKFSESINAYVCHKNKMGVEFNTGKRYLTALYRNLGDLELNRIKIQQVATFLDGSNAQVKTWRMKHSVLQHFFDFWASREEMPYLTFPPQKPFVRQTFVPFIYSSEQLRALVCLRRWKFKTSLEPITMRTFLLFLYATGAMVGEVQRLSVEDIDLSKRLVTIRGRSVIQSRCIPISADLCVVLRTYLLWRQKKNARGTQFFVNEDGEAAGYHLFGKCFRKQCEILNIRREQAATYQPRLHDMKCTFAVHRVTYWIRNNADLNRMLPALAAYMGMQLVSSERYLYLTPERFRKHLSKLSPSRRKGHWRNNPELMKLLSSF